MTFLRVCLCVYVQWDVGTGKILHTMQETSGAAGGGDEEGGDTGGGGDGVNQICQSTSNLPLRVSSRGLF